MIGKTISHYKILEKIGAGGMGVVYKVQDTRLQRTAALKFLPPALTGDDEGRERFIQEARAAAALDHQNICNIYEIAADEDDRIFISMAYYEGETLRDKIGREAQPSQPMRIDEAVDIALQVAEGLAEAHRKNIFHRDIKPANIIITKNGVVKIIDFGLARLKGETRLTKDGTTLGTAAYMSPEQARSTNADHRSDTWSLGVILYEMITGQLPFLGDNIMGTIYSIVNNDYEPVSAFRSDVPEELEQLIDIALSKDPGQRFQNTAHLVMELRKLKNTGASGFTTTKREITKSRLRTGTTGKTALSRRFMIPLIFFLIAFIIIAGYFLLKEKPGTGESLTKTVNKLSLAVVYFENKSGDESLDNWREAFSELLTTDLSQSKYLHVLRSDQVYGIFKKLNILEAQRYSAADLKKIAQKGRVNRIIKGSYIKAGDDFVITAMLIDSDSGETISSLSVRAQGEKNIFSKLDELTREIKLGLDINPGQVAADIDGRIGKITTTSPEAYKNYIEGIKYHNKGLYRKAIQHLEKALEIDPGFAAAYRKTAKAYSNLRYDGKHDEYLKKAFELRHRVSERERLVIEEDYYSQNEKTYNEAVESLQALLRLYPDDLLGNYHLGSLYENIEEWDKALEPLKVCMNNDDPFFGAYSAVGRIYMHKGMYEKAREVLENSIDRVANKSRIHRELAVLYRNRGMYDQALNEIGNAAALGFPPDYAIVVAGDIYFCRGDLEEALREYRKLAQEKGSRAKIIYMMRMASVSFLQGKFDSQKASFEKLIEMAKAAKVRWIEHYARYGLAGIFRKNGNPRAALQEYGSIWQSAAADGNMDEQRNVSWNKGLTHLEMGALKEAREDAEQLKLLIETGAQPGKIRYYYHLFGEIAAKKKDFPRAVDYFNKALSGLPPYWDIRLVFLYSLADVFFQAGDMEKAKETFEKVISFRGNARVNYSELVPRSFYKLGKIYREMGLKTAALNSYKKFVELWKDSDPRFQPLVKEARQGIKELVSSE
ncbi:MAG: protein kinase [Candidatus Aminicenantes bacterium]|nr:protein kinase [Candidatus Aminicenantes bacterium]